MPGRTRDELLGHLADAVGAVAVGHPVRVAIDGPPAAGKTTLAGELAVVLRARGRDVIQATIEDFLTARAQRYRRGEDSADGCYHDSFDFAALHRVLLDPLGPNGTRRFQQAVYDKVTDTVLDPPITTAQDDTVLLFDGVFLFRPELIDRWDLRIFVSAAFDQTLNRARTRDQSPSRSAAEVERHYRSRYLPSQQFYFDTARPTEQADIIVHNDDPQQPSWEIRTR
ncbi:MAG TPA: cytidylate kinase family protein [Pseudonocardiaceae bacterium]|nr:cytidylate kinase family protein [Pseudonocardiaceae bacterium]